MGDRMSFGDLESQGQRRKARREEFLERMDAIVPWDRWTALIEPHCRSQQRGRHVRGAETMLRMHLLQVMSGLSDGGTEDAILDSRAMQRFMHTGLMREQVPDATTLEKFRHILGRKGLGKAMPDGLDSELGAAGVMMRGGSIVDATFIEAPSSTKNEGHSRDPEAHQSKKGKNWHFGFKAHTQGLCPHAAWARRILRILRGGRRVPWRPRARECPPPEAQAVPRQVQRHIHQAPRPLPCLVRMDGAGAQVGRPAVGDPPGPGGAGQIRQHPQDAHRQGAALLGLVGAGELHVNCGLAETWAKSRLCNLDFVIGVMRCEPINSHDGAICRLDQLLFQKHLPAHYHEKQ